MMKRNVLATLLAALLVIGLLGLATAQGATAGADVELIAEQHVVLLETLRVPIQTRVAESAWLKERPAHAAGRSIRRTSLIS
jgi:hypothetical protein